MVEVENRKDGLAPLRKGTRVRVVDAYGSGELVSFGIEPRTRLDRVLHGTVSPCEEPARHWSYPSTLSIIALMCDDGMDIRGANA